MFKYFKFSFVVYSFFCYLTYCLYAMGESVYELRSAIRNQDVDKISHSVDFKAIKVSVKRQLKSYLLTQLSTANNYNDISAVEAAMAFSSIESIMDFYFSPDGLEYFFNSSQTSEIALSADKARAIALELSSKRLMGIENAQFLSPVSFQVKGYDRKNRVFRFDFSLSLYHWVLTNVELDLDAYRKVDITDFFQKLRELKDSHP